MEYCKTDFTERWCPVAPQSLEDRHRAMKSLQEPTDFASQIPHKLLRFWLYFWCNVVCCNRGKQLLWNKPNWIMIPEYQFHTPANSVQNMQWLQLVQIFSNPLSEGTSFLCKSRSDGRTKTPYLFNLVSYSSFCLAISCFKLDTRLWRALWLLVLLATNVSLLSLLLVARLLWPPTLLRSLLFS